MSFDLYYAGIDTSGDLWHKEYPGKTALSPSALYAFGIAPTGFTPCFAWFRGDLYSVGGSSRPLVRHRSDPRWLPSGITQPFQEVVVAKGTDSGGSPAATALCGITFVHKVGKRVLAESGLSNVVQIQDPAGEGYDWSNIQTTNEEVRVTHVRGYRSMNGGEFRMAFEASFGIDSISENVRTGGLLQPAPENRNLPPTGVRYATAFAGRMFYANTPENPWRVWWSEPNYPQGMNLLSFLDTEAREEITGLAASRDSLMIFCRDGNYLIRSFGTGIDDFRMQRNDSNIGCVSHFGIREIHNRLWLPADDGVWIYDGGFFYAMKDLRPYWRDDYEADQLAFLKSFAIEDRIGKNYILLTPRENDVLIDEFSSEPGDEIGTVAYVANYSEFERSLGGANPQPDWSLDLKGRREYCGLASRQNEVFYGAEDGNIRVEDLANDTDGGDAVLKKLVIETGHHLFFDPGGDIESGKTIESFWAHVEAEFNEWTCYLMPGDEQAWQQLKPDNAITFYTSLQEASEFFTVEWSGFTFTLVPYVPKSVHWIVPSRTSGRGLTVRLEAVAPVGMRYRGFGGQYSPGPAGRKRKLGSDIDSSPGGATKTLSIQYNYEPDMQGWRGINNELLFPEGSDPPGDITVKFRIDFISPAAVAPFQIRWYNPWNPDVFDVGLTGIPTNEVSRVINVPAFSTTVDIWADGADAIGSGMSSGENDSLTIDEESGGG